MIDQTLLYLRDTLNAYLVTPALGQAETAEDAVVFLDGDKSDPVSFRIGAVTVLLINVEQEAIMRAPNPYQRLDPAGAAYQVRPDIRLNLCILFVARFKQYEQALARLSQIISFFQARPVLNAQTAPALPASISHLSFELMTLPLAEQNDLWNALRATFQPSLLYRVRMLVFQDQDAALSVPVTGAERELVHAGGSDSDLRITHPFYDDQRCGDLAIAPTAGTQALLRRLQLTCKTFPDHVSLYAGLDPNGAALAAAAAPIALDFILRPRAGAFALITDLAAIAAQPAALFTNAGVAAANPLNLRLTTRTARAAETLVVRSPGAAEAFVLAGRPLAGAALANFASTGAGAVKSVSADLRRITVDTAALARGAAFQLSYPVRPDRPPDALAEVALALDKTLLAPAAAPRDVIVPLSATAVRWVFYIVTDFTGDIATLRIADATPSAAPRRVSFADAGRIDLSLHPDASDPVGLDLIRRNAGRRILRLISDAPVPARQSPIRKLELRLTDTRVIASLANPRPERFTSLRTAAAPAPAETVLYEIVTLISN